MSAVIQRNRMDSKLQPVGKTVLDLGDITLQSCKSHDGLYQQLMKITKDILMTRTCGIIHHGKPVDKDEVLTPTLENLICYIWLHTIDPALPKLIKLKYETVLSLTSLASIRRDISKALPLLLEELRSQQETANFDAQTKIEKVMLLNTDNDLMEDKHPSTGNDCSGSRQVTDHIYWKIDSPTDTKDDDPAMDSLMSDTSDVIVLDEEVDSVCVDFCAIDARDAEDETLAETSDSETESNETKAVSNKKGSIFVSHDNDQDLESPSNCYLKMLHAYEKNCICDICGKSFPFPSDLRRHMARHSGEKPGVIEKRHTCEICQKRYARSSDMKAHMRIHTGEKPYKCNYCEMRFNYYSSWKPHLLIHTGEKPYVCEICGKRLRNASNLKYHMRTHTGEKPHTCAECGKQFGLVGQLKNHTRTHTGEKPYECEVCHKRFTGSSALKRHMRTHTGEKPYVCHICNKACSQSGDLKRHIKTHTGRHTFGP